ncbi:TonB-dependent receptor plug domain-containing protein [Nibribacter ruber]|uniref:TonB-dependent receptor plug domain-containing protein n=1 Tax=Nibribacter ruber TaxID=2698458 RepID=A0A6P1NTH4_9BACT|nr:TonB-dependent receptor [Nibribacter ruber]QHL86340.1 TonB-dependent receptor plug domain-containing protein [Nibribacter ruber]
MGFGRLGWCLCLLFLSFPAWAQQAHVHGLITDTQQQPLAGATVVLQNTSYSTLTDAQGRFKLAVDPEREYTLVVTYIGYERQEKPLVLLPNETRYVTVELSLQDKALQEVQVRAKSAQDTRDVVSITKIDPRLTQTLPSPFQEFNKILVTLPGVTSNNELSSAYSVRGGNFDENLVYVNGMEVYRPFLSMTGQQEGLSFVNPDMVEEVTFSSGGWQPRYGDKLSSVLDIQYRTPTKFRGSVSGSLTGGSVHTEGIALNKRLGYLVGIRHKNAGYVLNSLEVEGDYKPKFTDVQTYLTYDLSSAKHRASGTQPITELSFLANLSQNDYQVRPETRETTFGTQTQVLRLLVGFDGQEQMKYTTWQSGLRLQHFFSSEVKGELIYSTLYSQEREFRDLEAGYRFCDVMPMVGVSPFNKCAGERGVGSTYNYSRNKLRAAFQALEGKVSWKFNASHTISSGAKAGHESIKDALREYSFTDSSDYVLGLKTLSVNQTLSSTRWQAYVQDEWSIDSSKTLTYGVRVHYWTVNGQVSISPRVQYAFRLASLPQWSFKAAAGAYVQPALYREIRDLDGSLVKGVENQQAWHFVSGTEYQFQKWGRPFKLTAEAYYKYMPTVNPFEQENMRLRYLPHVKAEAYAIGADVRVNGEFIKGEESWFSLGFLSTRENLQGDSTEVRDPITGKTEAVAPKGFIRRPTDQHLNFGIFFQDHLPANPTWKMYLNLAFSTGLPFGPPGLLNHRSAFNGPAYRRVDMGFSKLISVRGPEATGFGLESFWVSLEVLNLISANNVISYNYVRDNNGITYAVPNYLTDRLVNLRFIARF